MVLSSSILHFSGRVHLCGSKRINVTTDDRPSVRSCGVLPRLEGEAARHSIPPMRVSQVTLDNSHNERIVKLCKVKELGYVTSSTHGVKIR